VSRTVFILTVLLAAAEQSLFAQESKLNTNLGMGLTVPLNPTAPLAGSSVNVVVGAGYNFNSHHSLIGQFMWAGLPPNKIALRPIWIAAAANDISGSANLFALTANYRFQLQGKTFGAYVIGGGGMYYRHAGLSRQVDVGTGTICGPAWFYWGFGCVEGTVSQDQTLISAGSTAIGGNGGAGFTIRINEEGYKFYVEARYHYAATKNIPTTLIPITLGFSW
jgi:hypothetical protein